MHGESNYVNAAGAANAVDDEKSVFNQHLAPVDSSSSKSSAIKKGVILEESLRRLGEESFGKWRISNPFPARGEFPISDAGPFTATSFFSFAWNCYIASLIWVSELGCRVSPPWKGRIVSIRTVVISDGIKQVSSRLDSSRKIWMNIRNFPIIFLVKRK